MSPKFNKVKKYYDQGLLESHDGVECRCKKLDHRRGIHTDHW